MASDADGIAYCHHEHVSFLLQNFYVKELAEHFMMLLLGESMDAWWEKLHASSIGEKYGVTMHPPAQRPWSMRDFVLMDPSGVLWRIAENTP